MDLESKSQNTVNPPYVGVIVGEKGAVIAMSTVTERKGIQRNLHHRIHRKYMQGTTYKQAICLHKDLLLLDTSYFSNNKNFLVFQHF